MVGIGLETIPALAPIGDKGDKKVTHLLKPPFDTVSSDVVSIPGTLRYAMVVLVPDVTAYRTEVHISCIKKNFTLDVSVAKGS